MPRISISDTRRQYLKGIATTGAVATGLFESTPSSASAQETRGGPIILLGLDSELTPGGSDHGSPREHTAMVAALLEDVATDTGDILVVGAKPGTVTQRYWETVAAGVNEDVTFVNGANDIADTAFEGYAMIGIASSDYQLEPIGEWGEPPAGLTDDENEALIERREDLAEFVNAGGGLLGKTQDGMTAPYGYVDPLGEFETAVGVDNEGYVEIEVSPEGEALGLTQNGMSGWCCWHDVFPEFPDFVDTLVYNREAGSEGENEAAAVGGIVVIPIDVAISIDGPDETETGESEAYDIRVQNISNDEAPENVHVELTVTREEGIEDGDVALEYHDDERSDLGLSAGNGSLSATYGSSEGFPLPEEYDKTIALRATFEAADTFSIEADVVSVDSEEEQYANASTTVTVNEEDERPDDEVKQWPDSCNDIAEEEDEAVEEYVLAVDGSPYQGILSPDGRDAVRLNLLDGEFAAVTAQFDMSEELRIEDDGDASISTIDGDPIDQLESVEQVTPAVDTRTGYEFQENGEYALLLFAEVDRPCIELFTADDSAGSWSLALEVGANEPPIDLTDPIDEREEE